MNLDKYDHSLSSDCLNYCCCCGLKIHRSKQKMEFDLGKSSQFVVVQLGWCILFQSLMTDLNLRKGNLKALCHRKCCVMIKA